MKELNIWPFYSIDSRLGCMKEYNGFSKNDSLKKTQSNISKEEFEYQSKVYEKYVKIKGIHNYFAQLFLEFESFFLPMYYSSRNEKKLEERKLTKNDQDERDKEILK